MLHRIIPALALTLVLGACAIGNKYDYNAATATISADTDRSVSAAVVDQRQYVLSGSKAPNFVGLQRGGFGNPFDVTTQSGRGLAEDLTNVLQRGLDARGIAAKALVLPHGTGTDAALTTFGKEGGDRLLLVNMREWKTDAMMRLTLHWNLEAAVYDQSGSMRGKHAISGTVPIAGAGFESGNSNASSQQASQKLTELVNHPDIIAALR